LPAHDRLTGQAIASTELGLADSNRRGFEPESESTRSYGGIRPIGSPARILVDFRRRPRWASQQKTWPDEVLASEFKIQLIVWLDAFLTIILEERSVTFRPAGPHSLSLNHWEFQHDFALLEV
jgi:hypothetical protein